MSDKYFGKIESLTALRATAKAALADYGIREIRMRADEVSGKRLVISWKLL